jgi:hypothetical protein
MTDPTPEIAKNDSPTDSSTTVKFDVGGRLYKVSRASIEKFPSTMLARMISETWQKDPEATLFIDRDSDRFRFCLDYMRAPDKVWLPLNIPKEAFLDDLDFYGFQDVDPRKIHGGSSNLAAARHLMKCKEEHDKVFKAVETTRKCEELAYGCFLRFSQGDSLQQMHFSSDSERYDSLLEVVRNHAPEFDNHLAKYGLKFVDDESTDFDSYVELILAEKEDTIN